MWSQLPAIVDGAAAVLRIGGAIAFVVALLRGGISFIRNRPGFRHPEDFFRP